MYKYTLKDMCHVVMCHVRRLPLCIVGFWRIYGMAKMLRK